MPIPITRVKNKEQAKQFLGGVKRVKDTVIDKVSDVMSYPARRAAQKSMIQSDKKYTEIKAKNTAKNTAKTMQEEALKKIGNFPTKSKKNSNGEIINPTKNDVKSFNKEFDTFKPRSMKGYKYGVGVGP